MNQVSFPSTGRTLAAGNSLSKLSESYLKRSQRDGAHHVNSYSCDVFVLVRISRSRFTDTITLFSSLLVTGKKRRVIGGAAQRRPFIEHDLNGNGLE